MTKYKWVFIAIPILAGLALRQVMTELSPQSAKLLYGGTTSYSSSSSPRFETAPSNRSSNGTHVDRIEEEEVVGESTDTHSILQSNSNNGTVTYNNDNVALPPPPPLLPTIITREVSSRSNLLLFWVDGKPNKETKSMFVYYSSIAHAIDNNPNIDSCMTQSLDDCYYLDAFHQNDTTTALTTASTTTTTKTLPTTPLYVVFPHAITSAPGKLYRYITIISKKLKKLKEKQQKQFGGMSRPVYALLMVNKVYKNLDAKLNPFLDAFGDAEDVEKDGNGTNNNRNSIVDGALIMTWSPHATEWTKHYGMPFEFIPFGVDLSSFSVGGSSNSNSSATTFLPPPLYKDRECDVFVNWDNNPEKYRFRAESDEILWKHTTETTKDSHLYYNSTTGLTIYHPNDFLSESEYIHAMNNCKMVVSTIGMPGRFDLVGTRYYEVLSLGTSLLLVERAYNDDDNDDRHNNNKDSRRILPQTQQPNSPSHLAYSGVLRELIKENETVAMFSSVNEFLERALYYKTHIDEAQQMIKLGKQRIQNHSWDSRAKQLVTLLQNYHTLRMARSHAPESTINR